MCHQDMGFGPNCLNRLHSFQDQYLGTLVDPNWADRFPVNMLVGYPYLNWGLCNQGLQKDMLQPMFVRLRGCMNQESMEFDRLMLSSRHSVLLMLEFVWSVQIDSHSNQYLRLDTRMRHLMWTQGCRFPVSKQSGRLPQLNQHSIPEMLEFGMNCLTGSHSNQGLQSNMRMQPWMLLLGCKSPVNKQSGL